jgi:hypothetical protein
MYLDPVARNLSSNSHFAMISQQSTGSGIFFLKVATVSAKNSLKRAKI